MITSSISSAGTEVLQELCRSKPHGGKCRRLALLSRVEPRGTDAMICTIERELLDALDRVNPAARAVWDHVPL